LSPQEPTEAVPMEGSVPDDVPLATQDVPLVELPQPTAQSSSIELLAASGAFTPATGALTNLQNTTAFLQGLVGTLQVPLEGLGIPMSPAGQSEPAGVPVAVLDMPPALPAITKLWTQAAVSPFASGLKCAADQRTVVAGSSPLYCLDDIGFSNNLGDAVNALSH
jgi:hypothetical protein